MSLKLNVGCGTDNYGDVRIDIIYKHPKKTTYKKEMAVNVIADANYLPLRNEVFYESRCFHVLEHISDPKKSLLELKRVTKNFINIKVPVWHLYSYLIELIALFSMMLRGKYKQIFPQLQRIMHWKKRYSDHKYYIKFKNYNIKRKFFIPKEYEIILVKD